MAFVKLVSTKADYTNNGTSATITTPGIDTSGADLLVVSAQWLSFATADITITDSKSGNTWNPLTKYSGGGTLERRIFYSVPSSVGASHTFTASGSDTYPSIGVIAFSGAAATPFDQENGAVGVSVATLQAGSVTPSENGEVIIASVGETGSVATSHSIDGGFTIEQEIGQGSNMVGAIAYLIQTSAAAANPTWTFVGSTPGFSGAANATFKSAGGGGGGGGNPWYAYAQQRRRIERTWQKIGGLWQPDYAYGKAA